jgi:hypothetical protein
MRESCSCGAAIHTLQYKRALMWRVTHKHTDSDTEVVELDSDTQIIGFTLNEEYEDEEDYEERKNF